MEGGVEVVGEGVSLLLLVKSCGSQQRVVSAACGLRRVALPAEWPSDPLAPASSLSGPQFLSGAVEWGGELIPALPTSPRSREVMDEDPPCPQPFISEGADVTVTLYQSLSPAHS